MIRLALPLLLVVPALAQTGDSCADPYVIHDVGAFPWDNTGHTTSGFDGGSVPGGAIGCWGPTTVQIENDVFFEWTSPCGGDFTILVTGMVGNCKRSVHLGSDCAATCVMGIDDLFFNPWIAASGLQAGDTLLIQVGSTDPGQFGCGTIEIEQTSVPCPVAPPYAFACQPPEEHHEGLAVTLANSGRTSPGLDPFHLDASGGPIGEFGFFLVADGVTAPTPVFEGVLCLGPGQLGRYNAQGATNQGLPQLNSIGQFDACRHFVNLAGTSATGFGFDVPDELPFTPPGQTIQPGDSYAFQLWYRDEDATGAPSANFSDAIVVTFF